MTNLGDPPTDAQPPRPKALKIWNEAIVRKEIRLSCAHQLLFHPGKCAAKHGHNYKVEVFAKGVPDEHTGMVLDFDDMAEMMDTAIGIWDHHDLNPPLTRERGLTSILGGIARANGEALLADEDWQETTAENLCFAWLYDLSQIDPRFCGVRIWETDTCYAQLGMVQIA